MTVLISSIDISGKIITFQQPEMTSDRNQENPPSLIGRLDPRAKFFCFLLLALQIFAFKFPSTLIAAGITLTAAVIAGRVHILLLLKRLASISVFIAAVIGFNMFTTSGEVLFDFLGMYATREGLYLGTILSSRLVFLLLAATLFTRTTSISAIVDGIEITMRPMGRRFGAVIQVLTIALNFVPMLIQSAQQIKKAQLARGAQIDGNILQPLRFAATAALPLFATTLRSSEQLALAMEARCYDPLLEKSHYSRLRMTALDWRTIILTLAQFTISVTLSA